MNSHIVIPVLISFAISLILGPVVIPFLRKLKMGQTERVEGVQSHLKKAGTPTMGGVIILASVAVTSLIYVKDYPQIIPVLFLTVGFGLIGFLDDYLKVVMKRSDGLYPMQKIGIADRSDGDLCILSRESGKGSADHDRSVYAWVRTESWMACNSGPVLCSDRYCERYEFYRRTGRSCLQRHSTGCNIFYSCSGWNKEWTGTDHLCGCRSIDGIPAF